LVEAVKQDALLLQEITDIDRPVAKRNEFALIPVLAHLGQEANQKLLGTTSRSIDVLKN